MYLRKSPLALRSPTPASVRFWLAAFCALGVVAAASAAEPSATGQTEEEIPANLGRGLGPMVEAFHAARRAGREDTESFRLAVQAVDRAQVDDQERVLVEINPDGQTPLEQTKTDCEKAGGKITATIDWYRRGLISAWVPLKEVENLAKVPGISAIHLALRRRLRIGAATSQGVVVHKTNLVNTAGYFGAGVTVGALSDSYNNDKTDAHDYGWTTAPQDVATGDLPGVGNPFGYTTPVQVVLEDNQPDEDTDEGRAVLQIICDVAPAATLAFATAGESSTEFATNIALLQSQAGCQVMCDDIGFAEEPMFSDGVIAQAVSAVVAKGVAYFSAFGNDGNSGYEATFNPIAKTAGATRATAGGIDLASIPAAERAVIFEWHSFGNNAKSEPIVVQNITTGFYPTQMIFQWDDPFDVVNGGVKGITSDYDILVFNSEGTFLPGRSGTANNIQTNEPIELPAVLLAASTKYKICIVLTTRLNGSQDQLATRLRYLATDDTDTITGDFINLNNVTGQGHPSAPGCVGVAAYVYDITPNPGDPGHVYTPLVDSYSSNGPIDIYFDSSGNRLSTPVIRNQPVLSACDNVDTTFFPPDPYASRTVPNVNDYDFDGFPNFAGTSAASAHATGIAALLINAAAANSLAAPSPQDIQSILTSTVQGSIDEDPVYSQAIAGPVTVADSGDDDAIPNIFKITFTGTTGQELTKVVIDLAPILLHFDPEDGGPFTVVAKTGSPAPSAGPVQYYPGTTGRTSVIIPLSHFAPGDSLSFELLFDDDATSLYGGDADELAGATIAATVSGVTTPFTGTFVNQLGTSFNYKAGYGLLDANAAVNSLLTP